MRQNFIGMVVGTAMRKTVKVRVPRHIPHPVVKKIITLHKNYLVHDEKSKCELGDVVRIEACRPLSKRKSFTVAEIIKPARKWVDPETGEVHK
ncbi:nucleic acid-binding protein [Basidiobolus meristosporus CBS 931.73]|uniref:Small ribosomal subunit protein uS17c n=1 Tax=Basidiobolus meristosporus CBS 931.73 TaxID=1314790 RepID=A0A1Y1XXR6_9FUNG|nr:nucleic acid-binding protein [Basidiobolus meristosporus CBS 931.73]ORX95484.1 nucleic acid-binding protein [Basidiobolus meristosporus CBS 931.73]|eukprot:ORX90547.1 nucleic acid-binding protein [Basidiobolus meristosporus CBS 931.73]